MVIDRTWTCSCGNVNSEMFECVACGKKRDFIQDKKNYSSIFFPMKKNIPKRKRTKPSVWAEYQTKNRDEDND